MTTPGARAWIAALTSDFTELAGDAAWPAGYGGPLAWAGYAEQRERAGQRSGETESVVCGQGTVSGVPAVLVAFDFRFLGGSVGQQTGERIERAFTHARRARLPVVSLIATGGSRMQEGMRSLRQLSRIARQCQLTRAAGVPHLAVLGHPTTGGLWAALGASADVVLALAGAEVGFAGRRVRPAADADDPAFTSEGQHASGQVDQVVTAADLPAVLGRWLDLLRPASGGEPELAEVPRALGRTDLPADGWTAVRWARDPDRPRAPAYLADYFQTRVELSGDRAGGVDPGMLCGIGRRGGRAIAYAAQTGTGNTPAGFRTAARLIRLADRFGLPVLTLVDTPGAANGATAERAGLGPALAELFGAVAGARVPITTLVIGEGGSGGALALADPDRTWITPDGYFSVIAPEASAAILKRGPDQVVTTANQLRLRPQDLVELGIVRGISSR